MKSWIWVASKWKDGYGPKCCGNATLLIFKPGHLKPNEMSQRCTLFTCPQYRYKRPAPPTGLTAGLYRQRCQGNPPKKKDSLELSGIVIWSKDLDPDPAIFVLNLQDGNKKLFFVSFSAYYCWRYIYIIFLRIKSHKEVTKQYKSRFFLLLLLNDRRIRIRIHTSD